MRVTFYGVRGSTPCPHDGNRRYGANTSCVALEMPGEPPIILDIGTGLRFFGHTQPLDGSFRGAALVTHLHWDHVQGLPFFVPILIPGAQLTLYGPVLEDGTALRDAFDVIVRPPFFPITMEEIAGDLRFVEVDEECFEVGSAQVLARRVPHNGRTLGFRVSWGGASVAYIPDHQQPDDPDTVAEGVLALARGVDLLIHDAQYLPEEFERKRTWGHCTIEYALEVARRAGAKRLAMFHHDPGRDDSAIDALSARLGLVGEGVGVEVLAAYEGLSLAVGAPASVRP